MKPSKKQIMSEVLVDREVLEKILETLWGSTEPGADEAIEAIRSALKRDSKLSVL